MKRPYLLIGACQRPHGIKGEVLVKSLTEGQERFFQGLVCYTMDGAGERPVERLTLSGCRPTPQGLLLTFDGIFTREAARRLTGKTLAVKREDALALADEFEFYYGDLLGAEVEDRQRGLLGSVADILNAGSGDIQLVSKAGEPDIIIPFLRAIVRAVDPQCTLIIVDLPQGLFELYRQPKDGNTKED